MPKKMLEPKHEAERKRLFIKSGLKGSSYFFQFLFFETMLFILFTWKFITDTNIIHWLVVVSLGLEVFAWLLALIRNMLVRYGTGKVEREIRKTQEINLKRKEIQENRG